MSSTHRSASKTNHKSYTPDEFQRWRESHAKIAAIAFKEAGVRVIDFNVRPSPANSHVLQLN